MRGLGIMLVALFCVGAGPAAAEEPHLQTSQDPSARLLEQASSALADGRLVEARLLLDKIGGGTVDPSAAPLEARYALASGDVAKAMAILKASGGTDSKQCDWRIVRGLAADAQARTDETIAELGSAAADCRLDATSWHMLATALARRGEVKASVYAFQRASALAPDRVGIHTDFAHFLIQFGDPGRASIELAIALQIDPTDATAREDKDVAAGMLDMAIERDPTDSDERWAQRLAFAAEGARTVGDMAGARALAARAVIASPHFDADVFADAAPR